MLEGFSAFENDSLENAFWVAAFLSVVVSRIPYGKYLIYPFTMLGTWAHESGHGVAAIAAGGTFVKLELHSNFGGSAYFKGVGRFGGAFTAAGGLLGPAIAGGAAIIFGSREKTVNWVMIVTIILIVLSLIFVIRNLFGAVVMGLTALLFAATVIWAPEPLLVLVTQLVGIQLCVTSFSSLDYMFTKDFKRDGKKFNSDTQNIAEALILPYWFWGGLIALLSFVILGFSFYTAWGIPVEI